jgi:hypothetical protein
MKRRLSTILSALSLLLFAAVVATWVRSYWVADVMAWEGNGWVIGTGSGSGELAVAWLVSNSGGSIAGVQRGYHAEPPAHFRDSSTPEWSVLGLRYYRQSAPAMTYYQVRLPLWWIVAAVVLFGTSTALAIRRGRKRPPGLCSRCGYDLRATPGRCPECGAVPAGASIVRL